MRKFYKRVFANSLVSKFYTTITPRWLVFLADFVIVSFSCLILLLSDYYNHSIDGNGQLPFYILKWGGVIGVYMLMNLLTKSYTYIIRLSIVEDLYRVFFMVFSSTFLLVALNAGCSLAFKVTFFSYWNIAFVAAIVLSLMFVERILVKYLYSIISKNNQERERVVILGTSIRSVSLANSLKDEPNGKYLPVAFLELQTEKHIAGQIAGYPAVKYSEDEVSYVFDKYNAKSLIFRPVQLSDVKDVLADVLIKNDIMLLQSSSVEDFENLDSAIDAETGKPIVSKQIKSVKIEDLLGRDQIRTDSTLVMKYIHGSTVMITGAAGSIGSEIVRQVAAYGAKDIVLLDQAETPMHDMSLELKEKYPNIPIHLYICDVKNQFRLEQAFKEYKPKLVFHAAAYKHVPMMEINPTEAVLTNVLGTMNVANLAVKYNVKKFVMISTDKAVNPTNIMGTTKRIAEIYVQSLFYAIEKEGKQTQYITTRFGNVLGSNGSVIPIFLSQIEKGGPVTVTHKDIIRYFMTIPEACSLVLEAGCMGNGGEIYIFDMGKPIKIYDLAYKMISLSGYKPNVDIMIKETGLRPGEKLYEELLNQKETTVATINKKIMISKVIRYDDFNAVKESINTIVGLAEEGKIHDMVYAMKVFVPEYKSRNSDEFEEIDKEVNEVKAVESKEKEAIES